MMAGIVLTGNLRPHRNVLQAHREMPFPVLLAAKTVTRWPRASTI